MLYRPLFTTSFLLDDFLDDQSFFGAESVVLTSASSKTALGLAWRLHARRRDRVEIVGLTSPRNRAFVAGLGCYYSCLVGATHWDARAGARVVKGPAPQLFFAPAHIERRRESWVAAGLESRIAAAWGVFVAQAADWIRVERGCGPAAIEAAYFELLDGTAPPDFGHVLTLHT
jgi:hypothetical protein